MVRIACVVLAACAIVVLAVSTWPSSSADASSERCGVDRLRIHRTAEGHLLDFRYRVVDPERARSLLANDATAYLVHERSGRRLPVPTTPKAGALRNHGNPRAGRSYFALFANPGGIVQRGDRVSIVLGELTARLTVE